MTEWFNDMF